MILKYNIMISDEEIYNHLKKLTNQVYKLLPIREEASDWEKPLATIMEEFSGMSRLLTSDYDSILFPLVNKLEGLFTLIKDEDFSLYRRIIFECLSLISELMKKCQG